MADLRERLTEAVADALARYDYGDHGDDVERPLRLAQATAALDAALPLLEQWLKPHRWDHRYPESAPDQCEFLGPDDFYSGVLHACWVLRALPPSKRPDDPTDGCGDCTPEGNHPCTAGCRDAQPKSAAKPAGDQMEADRG